MREREARNHQAAASPDCRQQGRGLASVRRAALLFFVSLGGLGANTPAGGAAPGGRGAGAGSGTALLPLRLCGGSTGSPLAGAAERPPVSQSKSGRKSRAQKHRQPVAAGPATKAPRLAEDALGLGGMAPPATTQSPRGSRGCARGLGQFPAKGSRNSRRPGPSRGTVPAPKRCSICYSSQHRRPACPDLLVSGVESEQEEPWAPAGRSAAGAAASTSLPGAYPLLAACKRGNVSLVLELLAAGADANACDASCLLDSALNRAADAGHVDVAEVLLLHGANVHRRNRLGLTPLHLASVRGHVHVVQTLLTQREPPDVGALDLEGNSALHLAAREGFRDVCGMLLDRGALINAVTTVWRYTPLMYAAMRGEAGVVLQLTSRGADLHLKCAKGLDALGWAIALCRSECRAILESFGRREGEAASRNLTRTQTMTDELRDLDLLGLLDGSRAADADVV